MRRRAKSIIEELLTVLFELTGVFWQVGAAMTLGLVAFAILCLNWAIIENSNHDGSALLSQLAASFGWILYVFPTVIFLVAIIFGLRTYAVYRKQSHF